MKKNIKNANMVEIANARIMSIYESIMSEGILGALGGAAIGSAIGAGAGALGGDAFKGTDLVKGANSKFDAVATAQDKLVGAQDSLAHANRMANSAQKTANLAHTIASNPVEVAGHLQQLGDTHANIAKAALDVGKNSAFRLPDGVTDTMANPNAPTAEIHDMIANKYHNASTKIEKIHTSTDAKQPTLNDIAANADAELAKSKQAVTNAQKEVANKMTAVKDAKNNIGALDKAVKWSGDNPIAAGAAVGGTVGGAIGAFAHDDRKDEGDDEVLEDDDRLF